jgi:hypothetical protein
VKTTSASIAFVSFVALWYWGMSTEWKKAYNFWGNFKIQYDLFQEQTNFMTEKELFFQLQDKNQFAGKRGKLTKKCLFEIFLDFTFPSRGRSIRQICLVAT